LLYGLLCGGLALFAAPETAFAIPSATTTTAANAWGSGPPKEIGRSGAVDGSILLADAHGNATLAWISGSAVYSARYAPKGDAWSVPEQINSVPQSPSSPEIFGLSGVVDAQGNVIFAWTQDDIQGRRIDSARYEVGAKRWLPAVTINTPEQYLHANDPAVVVDRAGNVTAIWNQELPTDSGQVRSLTATYGQGRQYAIYGARYDSASGAWGAPQELGRHASHGFGAGHHNVVIDQEGNVTVAWFQQNISRRLLITMTAENIVVAVRYSSLSGRWSQQVTLRDCKASGGPSDCAPQLAVDTHGNVMAFWSSAGRWSAFYDIQKEKWGNSIDLRMPAKCTSALWDGQLSFASNPGFTVLCPSDDRSSTGSSLKEIDEALERPIQFGLAGVRYSPKDRQWKAMEPLTRTDMFQVASLAALNRKGLSPDIQPFMDESGNIDAFWIERRGVDTDRSLESAVIHGSRYSARDTTWHDGKSITLRPDGRYPWNRVWWPEHPPGVVREASGNMLFVWSGNFTDALPDNPQQGPRGRGALRSIGPMIVAARYHPDAGTWSDLAVLDQGEFVSDANPPQPGLAQLESLAEYGTLAVWWINDGKDMRINSRLLPP